MKHDRFDEPWQAWVCADCHPESNEEYDKAYMLLVPKGDPKPDQCPRCGSFLSFCEADEDLTVGNTLAQRWAAKQAAKKR